MEYSENEIQNILKLYKQKKEKQRENYEKIKDTEEFKIKNRQRASEHYYMNKEKKKQYYEENKEFLRCKSSYLYYKKNDRTEEFKELYPERYQILIDRKFITDEDQHNAAGSSSTES